MTTRLKRNRTLPKFDPAAHLVHVLNSPPKSRVDKKIQAELRKLIGLWRESGPNTSKMLRDNPGCLPQKGIGLYYPTATGRIDFIHFPAGVSTSRSTPKKLAQKSFLQFVVHPDCEKRQPDGPCACGCGQYFLKTSKHRKIYCKGHGSAVSASAAMKRKQAKKRALRVHEAKKAIRKYEELRKRSDWKIFVDSEIGISRRALGTWVEKGYIQAPKGHRA
jgi:hypothetical protein